MLAAARAIYGAAFNPQVTLKALSYFDDGDVRRLPEDAKERLSMAAASVDLDKLPRITAAPPPDEEPR